MFEIIECYFDNAATTVLCDAAKSAICDAAECYGNPSSLHSLGLKASLMLEDARGVIADAIGALPDEIYFTSGGTEADNLSVFGGVNAVKRRGNRIVTTDFEHAAVRNSMKELEKQGFDVVYLKPDKSGTVPQSAFEEAITKDTILVSCMSVNNETGAILPIEKIKGFIDNVGSPALFHCDATQSFMKYKCSPKAVGADLMTLSAHKIHGPKGVGALYLRKGARILPHIFGGEQEKSIRPGTQPLILINAFAAAVKDFGNAYENAQNAKQIKDYVASSLIEEDDIVINSPESSSDYILNLSVIGIRSETMLHFLEQRNIFVSSGSACSRGKTSHVLKSLGFDKKRADSALRISFSKFSNLEQARLLTKGIIDAKNTLIRAK